jgi:outer membrane protein assembly factor BamB
MIWFVRLGLSLLIAAGFGCDGAIDSSVRDGGGPGDAVDSQGSDWTTVDLQIDPASDGATKPPGFKQGNVYVAGSRNAEVFEFAPDFTLLSRWTHPAFGTVLPAPGQPLSIGPNGMSFDRKGNLVVAAYKQFCVFSKPNVPLSCHDKIKDQATENIIFDHLGNIYTTTSTGGTNEVHKYDDSYKFITTFSIKTGELTGITCDPDGNLYIASQDKGQGHVYKVDYKTFTVLDTIDVSLTGIGSLEGLQYLKDKTILVGTFGGNQGLLRINASSPFKLVKQFNPGGLYGAVPVTIDAAGNLYTADYENGSGTAAADLFALDPAGTIIASKIASPVYGPFGMVVAGVELPCGAYKIE